MRGCGSGEMEHSSNNPESFSAPEVNFKNPTKVLLAAPTHSKQTRQSAGVCSNQKPSTLIIFQATAGQPVAER
jgi:hypothetical protein